MTGSSDNVANLDEAQQGSSDRYGWIDTFAGVLLEPRQTMSRLAAEPDRGLSGLPGACICVVLVSFAWGLKSAAGPWSAVASTVLAVAGGLTGWLLLTGFLSLIALCLQAPASRVKACLATTGWAFLPWLFVCPLAAYHQAFGSPAAVVILIPFVWVTALLWIAVQESFHLSGWQMLILVAVVPPLAAMVELIWSWKVLIACARLMVER